ncbi:RNA recognition family protein [Cryptosporidium andersoni]|uniref:RNA recognition family protein n=1 Tax=Cryptosporidium andersoni TaxID=117008 RepID=A0A1J4MHJ0_9CRYT|nr:RNA recognition family protein [Cryptosporidium andersoni]
MTDSDTHNTVNEHFFLVGQERLDFLSGDLDVDIPQIDKLKHILFPLSKEQLVDILARCAFAFDEVRKACVAIFEKSPVSRRVMVRNISFNTSDKAFVDLFCTFGEIDDAIIVREKSGKSRGYGFVTFKSTESIHKLFDSSLCLDGRQLLLKLAADPYAEFTCGRSQSPKDLYERNDINDSNTSFKLISKRKLFVRNLSDTTTAEKLKEVFSQFGNVEDCVILTDSNTGLSKRCGFVTFKNISGVMKALKQQQQIINGKVAFISLAFPQKLSNNHSVTINSRTPVPNTLSNLNFPVPLSYLTSHPGLGNLATLSTEHIPNLISSNINARYHNNVENINTSRIHYLDRSTNQLHYNHLGNVSSIIPQTNTALIPSYLTPYPYGILYSTISAPISVTSDGNPTGIIEYYKI